MGIMDVLVEEINRELPDGEKVERLHSKPYEIKEKKSKSRPVKWTQWNNNGMTRCGEKDYKTVMGWMGQLGLDAKRCVKNSDKPHALYGRTIHENGKLEEIRFYCNVYLSDDELDEISRKFPNETLYVAHK